MRILDRYVIREIVPPLLLSLLIFTFILEIPPVMDQLEALVAKGVPWGVAAQMLLTLVPQALGLTIPMALLVGLLIGLGRMSGDREAMALLACGVSPYRLLRPVLFLATIAGIAHLYVMIWAIPNANQTFRQLTYDVVTQQVENDVRPQVFFDNFPGWVLYARDIPPAGGWEDVLVADTSKADATVLYMAARGRLVMDRVKQTVDLVLEDGTRYSSRGPDGKELETYRFPQQLIVKLDPQSVFPRFELLRGVNELPIPALEQQAADKLSHGVSAHPEIIAIQQKFSFPVACLVFVVIGLALGLTVAREGKVAGFVVGIAVIFAYYVLLYLAEAVTKGFYTGEGAAARSLSVAYLARWFPNIVLLPFGIVALIWRARWAEGRLPFRSIVKLTTAATAWVNRRREGASAAAASAGAPRPSGRRGVVIVVRVPHLSWLLPNILDRYISRIYLRAAAISFAALLGIFYIATFIDRSDKLFKGQATAGMMMRLLGFMTPQFIYYVIPLAALLSVLVTFGLLSRSSELTVMKACGISLYRVSAPVLLLSLVWSGVLFGLEQQILARANQRVDALDSEIRHRPPRTSNPLNRQWLVGHDGNIYHYTVFEPQAKAIQNLVIYRPAKDTWRLQSQLFTPRATWTGSQWIGVKGWQQDYAARRGGFASFSQRTLPLETPDYFETQQPLAEMMTVPQLKRFIDEQKASGFNVIPMTIELQKKLAFPFVTVVMTLLAIPFGLTTGKRGTLYGVGIGIVLALTYWITGNAFAAIGKAGILSPIMAGWAPNVLAAGCAAYMLLTART
jgi:LPS export ABC transporter permease LptG/LPS export ABC transporter permease LptF